MRRREGVYSIGAPVWYYGQWGEYLFGNGLASHADVLRGSSRVPAPRGAGRRDEPLRASAWEAGDGRLLERGPLSRKYSTQKCNRLNKKELKWTHRADHQTRQDAFIQNRNTVCWKEKLTSASLIKRPPSSLSTSPFSRAGALVRGNTVFTCIYICKI